MKLPNPRAVLFGINCYLACVTAFAVASAFDLRNPSWAMITVFITSLPIAGAILSKAIYRILGTLLGAAASLLIIPNLSPAPELALAATAGWVGAALFLSLLFRGPHSYAFMLAGYTAALVGFPQIVTPTGTFDIVVARTEEICIGIACSAFFHGLFFPLTAQRAILGKLGASLADMRNWMALALSGQSTSKEQAARKRFAADLTELTLLAAHLPFEPSARHATPKVMRALEQKLIEVLPLATGVEDRLQALEQSGTVSDAVSEHLRHVAAILRQGDDATLLQADHLIESSRTAMPALGPSSSWSDLLTVSLLERLAELITAWRHSLQLAALLRDPGREPDRETQALVDHAEVRVLHVDAGLAVWSGLAAALGVLATGMFSIAINWTEGFAAVGLSAVLCSLFATFDDPTPMIRRFLTMMVLAVPIAALYAFAIVPAIDGLPLLYAVMAPVLISIGTFMANPKYALQALAFAILFFAGLGLTPNYVADFNVFVVSNLSALVGGVIGLVVTNTVRVLRADVSARRILRAAWNDLAALTADRAPETRALWASRMLDRQALLLPRVAQVEPSDGLRSTDALNDLRVGVNVVGLRELQEQTSHGHGRIEQLLAQLDRHFRRQAIDGPVPPNPGLIQEIDGILRDTLLIDDPQQRTLGVTAGVGLRRSLFPTAPPYPTEALA